MASIGFKAPNIGRLIAKLVGTLLMLWAGGSIVNALGTSMNGTASPFYKGLTLIGWTIRSGSGACHNSGYSFNVPNCITATGGTGVLAVIGIIGLAAVILEFVTVKY